MTKHHRWAIGIDPGRNGAIAAIDTETNEVTIYDCPTRSIRGKSGKPTLTLDHAGIARIVRRYPDAIAAIEKVSAALYRSDANGRTAIGAKSAATFMENFGAWQQACACTEIATRLVTPSVWKRSMALSSDKARSVRVAEQFFPPIEIANSHDRAEAALLALYLWRLEPHRFLRPAPVYNPSTSIA